MIKRQQVWNKVKRGLALNLCELAIAAGYDRGVLSRMGLPLQEGKLSLDDFKRVMRQRQNLHERARRHLRVLPTPPSGSPGANLFQSRDADRFYAPSSKRANPAASRSLPEARRGSTG